jgi:IclR family acetate operon transcriptional repressor
VGALTAIRQSARDEQSLVQSVGRAFDILEALAASPEGLGVHELARRLGLKAPTAHNLLKTLVARSYAEQDPATLRYRLGLGAFLLARGASRAETILRAAEESLYALAEGTGESSALGIWDSGGLAFIANIDSTRELSVRTGTGRAAAHRTASGLVLLANMPEAERDEYIRAAEPTDAPDDLLREPGKFRRRLGAITRQGLALIVRSGSDGGITAMATPLRARSGEVVAAIGVSGPTARMGGEVLAEVESRLREAADAVSRRLGFRPAEAGATCARPAGE